MPKVFQFFLVYLCGIFSPAWPYAVMSIDDVMALISGHSEGQVAFTETKHLPFLKQSLETSGLLIYRKPDFFSKQIQKPQFEQYDIVQETVVIKRHGEAPVSLQLSDSRALSALTAAVRGPLLGDRALLERFFTIHLGGQKSHWLLVLSPKDDEISKTIEQIKIQGQNDHIQEILIREPDGSLSTLRLKYVP